MKANITTRIALRVATQVDSRTILDTGGAESLLGNGDMLLKGDGAYKMKRIQGAFISDEETLKIVDHIKKVAKNKNIESDSTSKSLSNYLEKAKGKQSPLVSGFDSDEDEVDEFFEEAKQIALSCNGLSASSLMTRLSVGWQRASRIIYQLEQAGIIGPQNGSKPREVLVSKEQYEALLDQGTSGVTLHNKAESEAPDSYLSSDDGGDYSEDNEDSEVDEEEVQVEDVSEDVEEEVVPEIEEQEDIKEEDTEEKNIFKEEGANDNIEEEKEEDSQVESKEDDEIIEAEEGEVINDTNEDTNTKENVSNKKNTNNKEKEPEKDKEKKGDKESTKEGEEWWDEGMYFSK
jgi:hypothetical protein